MKKFLLGFCLVLCGTAYAHVRQRYFFQIRPGEGPESIIHWNFSSPVALHMNQFSGNLDTGNGTACGSIGGFTCLTFSNTRDLMGTILQRWSGTLDVGLSAALNLSLDSNKPIATSNNCEAQSTGDNSGDGINNILFTSKKGGSSCAYTLSSGTIGLTRIRYNVLSGEISEADMQFDDTNYRFTLNATNDLTVTPREISLENVVAHEMGHFWGLDHSSVRQATMIYSIAEGLGTLSSDDQMGLLSLYPPANLSTATGTLRGSVMAGTQPYFGATVMALNARTLEVSASEMTNVNGAFEFCALPTGPQVLYALRYKPYGRNLHEYYAGIGDQVTTGDDMGCYNPGCTLMTSTLAHSFFARSSSVGADLDWAGVAAGSAANYANISGTNSTSFFTQPPSSHPGTLLTVDNPKVLSMGTSSLNLSGTHAIGTHYFRFVADAADTQVRTASFKLYGRLKLELSLYQSDGSTVIVDNSQLDQSGANENCTITNQGGAAATYAANTLDPYIRCQNLTVGTTYALKVTGTSLACSLFAGNSTGCAATGVEAASTSAPYYMLNIGATSLMTSNPTKASSGLSASWNQLSRWQNLPSCSAKSLTVSDSSLPEDDGGGCCGSIKDVAGGPDLEKSFWLSILLNPLAFFMFYWAFVRRFLRHR